jgi:hypothetical protein
MLPSQCQDKPPMAHVGQAGRYPGENRRDGSSSGQLGNLLEKLVAVVHS